MPWWRDWTFCNGLVRANSSTWVKVWTIHIKNPNAIISKFLACSSISTIMIKYIEMLFNFDKEMGDILNDFHYIIARHANNKEILDNVLRNLMWIPR